jgi:hypothetical protein
VNILRRFSYNDKKKVIEDAGISESARVILHKCVHLYGHDLAKIAERVRKMFELSEEHHDRLAYRDAIAKCIKLDMADPKDRDTLWEKMDEELNPGRKLGGGWITGEEDPEPKKLIAYMNSLYFNGYDIERPQLGDLQTARRMAISRTLVYIRALPPAWKIEASTRARLLGLPDAEFFPEELENCWKEMQRHPHYRNPQPPKNPRHELNQHALDSISERYSKLWIEPQDIGTVRSIFEPALSPSAPLFWFLPFVIFKYATRCKIESRNHNIKNPLALLWNKSAPGHEELWGGAK